MRIIVDLDDVIADTHAAWQRWHAAYCPVLSGGCCDLAMAESLDSPALCKCGHAIMDFWAGEVYQGIQPVHGAIAGLERLWATHDVWIASNILWEYPHQYGHKLAWLQQHLGRQWEERFVATRGNKNALAYGLLIDDHPRNIEQWPALSLVYNRPWNQAVTVPRVKSWADILDKVSSL